MNMEDNQEAGSKQVAQTSINNVIVNARPITNYEEKYGLTPAQIKTMEDKFKNDKQTFV
jgi:hypothetical protein